MLKSMTGFATREGEFTLETGGSIHATFTLKSLNGRYFEAHCKLPQPFYFLETDIIKALKDELVRGTIYLTMHLRAGSVLQADIKPALSTVRQYVESIATLQKELSVTGELTVTELIRLPNIFESHEPFMGNELKEQILSTVKQLSHDLNTVRTQEGSNICKDLVNRIQEITAAISLLEPRAMEVMEKKKSDINQLLKDTQPTSIASEAHATTAFYVALDKIDIHEEITRFKSLLEQLTATLDSATREKGKKLDFTLQELFRETNTIAAKCADAQISTHAINIKVELEKARELVQNIL